MKYLLILFFGLALASCSVTKPAIEITKFDKTDSTISVGLHIKGNGKFTSNTVVVKSSDITYNDSTYDANILIQLRTK